MWLKQIRWTESQVLALLLVSVSSLAGRLAITEPGTPWYWPVLAIGGYMCGALVVAVLDARTHWFSHSRDGSPRLTWAGTIAGLLLLIVPFAEGAARIVSETYFRPLEQVTLVALTNFAFFAIAIPRVHRACGIGVLVSFVLLIAALMLGEHTSIVPLTAAYGGLAVAWLAVCYWRSVTGPIVEKESARIPKVPIACLTLLLACVTAASTRMGRGMPDVWGEWMPSSGGSLWANPAALLGIGDGDWVVSGPNAKTTGSIDSEYFLESDLPSFYDAMTEAFGEPREMEEMLQAIFVSQEKILNQRASKAPDMGSAGRQFSLYRKGRSLQSTPSSEKATALLYAEGTAPLHLSMTVYERFDGVNWHEPNARQEECIFETRESDTSWMWLPLARTHAIPGETRQHQLRFGRLSSKRLPLPNHLERLRFGQQEGFGVKRWAEDVLTWAHDGVLRARQSMPAGTYLEVMSHALDRSRLFMSTELLETNAYNGPCLEVPKHLRSSANALAERFMKVPRGWEQIDALLKHLRVHYVHDRNRIVPSDCKDPIHHFLHQARRGPAYQFATTATLALRSLGYATRVVSGFYVDPKDYEARAGHTPVRADDAHFWIEVRTVHGDWITFDPTPGYLTEWYQPTLLGSATRLTANLRDGLLARPLTSIAGLFFGMVLFRQREWLQERLLTFWCLWCPLRSPERRLSDTLQLLDLRSKLNGHQRPDASTPYAWYRHVDEPACRAYLIILYSILYGPSKLTTTIKKLEVDRTCRTAVQAMGRDVLRTRRDTA